MAAKLRPRTLERRQVRATRLDLGRLNTVVALFIAFTKALLVALFFMHLRYSSRLTQIVAAAGLGWLVILLGLTMGDYLTRDWIEQPEGWALASARLLARLLTAWRGAPRTSYTPEYANTTP